MTSSLLRGSIIDCTLLFVVISCGLLASAQTETATVRGRVADSSGALVSSASVRLIDIDRGMLNEVASNASGFYTFASVRPGRYRMEVMKEGFRVVHLTNLTVNVQDNFEENFRLDVGAVSESVTVEANAANINTTDASVSTVVDQSYVANMPLNGRSFQDLILLTPGTVTQTPQGNGYGFPGASGEFSVNGQRTEENYYSVDGVSANVGASGLAGLQSAGPSGSVAASTALGTTQALVSVDDLQEFRVQSSSYSAEYGRNPGAQLAFETKSGSNQFHGSAYDYLRNDFFDAPDYFTDYFRSLNPTQRNPATRQNDFGGTLGGPVVLPYLHQGKDKTFFFASYEGLRLTQPQPTVASWVPDAALRSFVSTNQPSLAPVLNAFPVQTPNAQDDTTDGIAQFVSGWSNPSSIDSTSVRFDHVVKDKVRLFFRFSDTDSSSATRAVFSAPSEQNVTSNTIRTYTAGATSLLTNRLSNDLRLNYSSNFSTLHEFIDSFGGSSAVDLGQLSGTGPGSGAQVLLISGQFLVLAQGTWSAATRQWNLVDTLSLAVGRHQLKFGADYRRLASFGARPDTFLTYAYCCDPSSVQANGASISGNADGPGYPLFTNFSAFADDQWKASSRLTLSMGLRWDVNPPPGTTQGINAYTIQGTEPTNWTLAPQGTPLWKTTWFNFAPRLGAAYVIRDKQNWETVVRAGGGVFFDTGQQMASLGFIFGPGFQAGAGSNGPAPFPYSPAEFTFPTISNPPDPASSQPYGFYPHLQLPYTLQWNASLEQALGNSQALTLSYVGSHASRLLQQTSYSPASNVENIRHFQIIHNGLTSDYDSAQVQFQRRLNRGLTALASYTWSHCIDYGSSNFALGYQRGNCDFDVRHNLSAAFSYDLPNVGHSELLNALVHHWGIDDRFTARTAFPVTLVGQSFAFGQGFVGPNGQLSDEGLDLNQGHPVYVYGAQCANIYFNDFGNAGPGGQPLPCPGGRAINPEAFSTVPNDPNAGLPTRLGNAPRNFARGFGALQMNLAIRREFPVGEKVKLQFRAESFNIFNHPNFGFTDMLFGSPTFGQATQTLAQSLGILNPLYQMGGPRSMQFALKVVF